MNIFLKSLKLKNFKGISSFSTSFSQNTIIYGDNATGKTTLTDAFFWLLFNKNSQWKSDFTVKPLDKNGNEIHNLETEVEAELQVDDKTYCLKKVLVEKWTKKRGSVKSEFTGNTIKYYIDGVPAKKSEFDKLVSGIIDEKKFKLITNPTYFPSLHWQERRDILLNMIEDINTTKIIASNKDFELLKEYLENHTIEDVIKIFQEKRRSINKELKELPARISEVNEMIKEIELEVNNLTEEKIKQKIAELEKKRDEYIAVKNKAQNSDNPNLELLNKIEAKIREIEKYNDEQQRLKDDLEWNLARSKDIMKAYQSDMEKLNDRLKELREEYIKVNKEKWNKVDICQTCGQKLPDEMIEEARAKWEKEKAEKLKEIKTEAEGIKKQISNIANELQAEENEVKRLEKEVEKIEFKDARDLEHERNNLLMVKQSDYGTVAIDKDIEEVNRHIANLQELLGKIDNLKRMGIRVNELQKQEKELAVEYEKAEEMLYLAESFLKKSVELVENDINSKFGLVKFKLFNILINGGVETTCEITLNGVPYNDLNTAGKIQAGLDIIRTLQKEYNCAAPVWIDNRESITSIPEMNCQVINLFKDEKYKKLEVVI